MPENMNHRNPARGAAGREAALKAFAERRAQRAQAELEGQGYLVVDPERAEQVRAALRQLGEQPASVYARNTRAL